MNKQGHRNYSTTVMAIKTESLISVSGLQNILYFLVIAFIFTSSKYIVTMTTTLSSRHA